MEASAINMHIFAIVEGILEVALFTVLYIKRSMKKQLAMKNLRTVWETFLYENNYDSDFCKLLCSMAFIPFLPFCRNQKHELIF